MVRIRMGTEGQSRIEPRPRIQRQAVLLHERLQVLRAKVFLLRPVRVRKVEVIQTKLVGHHNHPVIRHTASAKAMPLGS